MPEDYNFKAWNSYLHEVPLTLRISCASTALVLQETAHYPHEEGFPGDGDDDDGDDNARFFKVRQRGRYVKKVAAAFRLFHVFGSEIKIIT